MTDDFSAELDSIAASVPAIPSSYGYLSSLIQTLPSPLYPEIRSGQQGQVNTAEPGTTSAQLASSLVGNAPGTESGASSGVVSELFYGNANLLSDPAWEAASAAVVPLGAADTQWARDWYTKYVTVSGPGPGAATNLAKNWDRTSVQSNPFNSSIVSLQGQGNAGGATEFMMYVYPVQGWRALSPYQEALPFLVASCKIAMANGSALPTFEAWMEIVDSAGPVYAGPRIQLAPLISSQTVNRISVAMPRPGGGWASGDFRTWRLAIRCATTGASGALGIVEFGEPTLALSATQDPTPYSPIIARWAANALLRSTETATMISIGTSGATSSGVILFGGAAGFGTDVGITRAAAGVLLIHGSTSSVRGSIDMVAGTGPGTPAAGRGRIYFSSATKTYHQVDDAGVDTDLAATGGAGGLTLTTVEVNVGSVPRRSGKFSIAGAGLTVGKAVLVRQANGPYTGKGTRPDEAEMDLIVVSGKVTSATNIDCYWNSRYRVRGNIKFDYAVSG